MFKKSIIPLLLVFLISIITGCGSSQKNASKNPSVGDIEAKIKQVSDLSNMKKGDSSKLKKLYDINSDEIDSFILYTAPSNLKAEELAVIKVKDAKDIDNVKSKISKRVDKQTTSFKDYLPDEYYLIQKNIVKVNGNYICFIISKDAEKISSAFDESFK